MNSQNCRYLCSTHFHSLLLSHLQEYQTASSVFYSSLHCHPAICSQQLNFHSLVSVCSIVCKESMSFNSFINWIEAQSIAFEFAITHRTSEFLFIPFSEAPLSFPCGVPIKRYCYLKFCPSYKAFMWI